jgi:hypothetical protein
MLVYIRLQNGYITKLLLYRTLNLFPLLVNICCAEWLI